MSKIIGEELYEPNIVDPGTESIGQTQTNVEDVRSLASEDQRLAQEALKRLQEYINNSLTEPDAETAMLGVANGMLMKMLFRLESSIESVLAEGSTESEHLAIIMRGIEVALRLTWQVSRFTHLRIVLNDAREATARLTKR